MFISFLGYPKNIRISKKNNLNRVKASFILKGRFLKLFWYDAHPSKYFDTADKLRHRQALWLTKLHRRPSNAF